MTDVPARLRARRIVLIAAALSGVGLLVSIPAPSTLNLIWFVVLSVCLGLSFMRTRHSDADKAESPTQEMATVSQLPGVSQAHENTSAFLASVGHDLRQPLQAISLYAATLATHPLPDASKQLVGGLELAAETLSAQFEEVMAIAKLACGRIPLDPKPVALGAVLSSTVATYLDQAHDKSLHLRYVGTPLRVWADETLLARAVDRLVAHAVQTTERGGVLVGCRRRGDALLLEVRDTSGGIAPELLTEVFKPFSGYGQRLIDRALGLVLAERIVKLLGGTLSLRSIPGRGNIYTIRLPRLTGPTPV
ncbi:MAG: hybrid sensor histidine kinase/response regulator [Rhodocyclales bacterium]|nr:hybrid sensor histidine kinase/response regulator [Rhodocyclales bacterium]